MKPLISQLVNEGLSIEVITKGLLSMLVEITTEICGQAVDTDRRLDIPSFHAD